MSSFFLVLIIFAISSAVGQSKSTQLDKLSGKMLNSGQCEGAKALGYLYDVEIPRRLCSIALINLNRVIADSSCVPTRPNYRDIKAVFLDNSMQYKVQMRSIHYPKYILEEHFNATLVIFFLTEKVVVTEHVSPPEIWIQPSLEEGPGSLIGWDKRFRLAVDDIMISATDGTSHNEIFFSRRRNNLPKTSGQLVVRGNMLLGFSLLAQNQRVPVYLAIGSIHAKIISLMQEQELDDYHSPRQQRFRRDQEQNERLQHLYNQRS